MTLRGLILGLVVSLLGLLPHALAERLPHHLTSRRPPPAPTMHGGAIVELPFYYPMRPTLMVNVGGKNFPMLVDSGVREGIFLSGNGCLLPDSSYLGKHPVFAETTAVDNSGHYPPTPVYINAKSVIVGGLRLKDISFRMLVDHGDSQLKRDYCGAVPIDIFESRIIQFDNDKKIICLGDSSWSCPSAEALILPVHVSALGYYIPVTLASTEAWVLVDTGFSGLIAIWNDSADPDRTGHAQKSQIYTTWSGAVELEGRGPLGLSFGHVSADLANSSVADKLHVEAVSFTAPGPSLPAKMKFGGILGAGLLSDFNYAFDLESLEFYIWPLT